MTSTKYNGGLPLWRDLGLVVVEHVAVWGYRTFPDGRRSPWAFLPGVREGIGS
ncbi:hypothetical protein ABZ419_03000 [Streptomyces cinnamoneus]|uniref:hypothetical protein n=1 Tax=Streptomyces cinnamoneus TaxID=53446 RepID=UPI0034102BD7